MSLRACLFIALGSGSAYSQSDVTPPSLLSLSFGPASIDTRPGPQDVIFTGDVSDDLAGLRTIALTFVGPSNQLQYVFLQRISGTPLLGAYATTFAFPQFTASGAWRLNHALLDDFAGNTAIIGASTLQARGFPTTLNVLSTPDITPPQIQTVEFTPATINVSAAPAAVTLRMRLTDAQTGLGIESTSAGCNCTYQVLTLASPTGVQTKWVGNTLLRLVSGTRNDGIWEASFEMPRYSAPGIWTVQSLDLRDVVNNRIEATGSSLAAAGLASGFTVSAGSADVTMPTLTSLALNPSTIDPSLASQTVTITFGVQDNLSGLDFVRDQPCPCRVMGVELRSPSGNQYVVSTFNPFTQISGNALSGTWRGTAILPRFAEAGTWSVDVYLRDRAQNIRRLLAAELQAAGLPSGLVVIRPSYATDGTLGSAGGEIIDQVFGSQARIEIPNGALTGPTTISIDVLEVPPNIPTPQGFSAPRTRFVNFELIPHPNRSLGPPGYKITIPLPDPLPPGTVLTLFRLDTISGTLVPARSVSALPVTGTVDMSGHTATFMGIASFSTVVGLIASGQKPGDLDGDGVIGCADVRIVRAAFGKRTGQAGFDSRADVNRDGVVNISDLSFVLRQLPLGLSCL